MSISDVLSLLFIALSLSADCFAVSICGSISMTKLKAAPVLRTALAFGIAQAVMPLIGWAVGRSVVNFISSYAFWVAFGLLLIVGGRMLWEAFHNKGDDCADITRGVLLITMAIATSIDALAVGLSFAFLDTNIALASSIIGVVAFLLTIVGFTIGRKVGGLLGERAKILGGLVLIGIGIRILVENL
jgi:manganese efflux pump family protein